MKKEHLEKEENLLAAKKIIQDIKYINIASITPEKLPWNTPVYTAFDDDVNFYWVSWKKNQHSINVENNENVFVTIYDSTVSEGMGVGVYFQGTAKKITNPVEMLKALTLLYTRSNKKVKAIEKFLNSHPRRVYQFTPQKIYINGYENKNNGEFIDFRTELNLEELQKMFKK